ncbi:uncharacterized protein LOC143856695 [Tasmannia lanceolata]|uniref:uncharacterized protein LOC143856695 n=1 Tax=Tasmannia lanceolata TaxID=3420 RepID=UPI0040646653
MAGPLPFAMWGMDLVSPFPKALRGHTMLYVAINYFTKWVEVKAVARPNFKATVKFFYHDVVCCLGIPKVFVTDNRPQFASAEFCRFCDNLSIEHQFASVAHPQANGQVEAYRTTPQAVTGEYPFSLTFGVEAVIQVEIGLSTFRTENYDEHENSKLLRNTINLVLEKREQACLRIASYQQKVVRYYNSRVRKRSVKLGDLVLRRSEVSDPQNSRKLAPKWEEPYKVARALRPGAYQLEHLDGTPVPRSWNMDSLQKFYQ